MSGDDTPDSGVGIAVLRSELNELRSKVSSLEKELGTLRSGIADQIDMALDNFTIMPGQNIVITGQGRNITIGTQPGGPLTATWTIVCNPGTGTMTGTLTIPNA